MAAAMNNQRKRRMGVSAAAWRGGIERIGEMAANRQKTGGSLKY